MLAWTGQNILLVISSIFRLDLYVAAYSLTYLRLAAFIWMMLVAVGLLLMLIQIILKKPNSWLLTANAISLAVVLYGCCFINAPRLVASYNVEHCREVGGTGPNLDFEYLARLARRSCRLEAHLNKIPVLAALCPELPGSNHELHALSANWRAWGFRTWRLERYLS